MTRTMAGVLLTLLPFAHGRLNSIQMLGVYVGISGFLIAVEMVNRLEQRPTEQHAAQAT